MSAMLAAFLCLSPVAVDGDTLRCARIGRVRVAAIDAPEMPGHCRKGRACTPGDALASKAGLAALVRGRAVRCTPSGRDHYGRIIARCTAAGVDLSCEQVRRGRAVVRYGKLEGCAHL